MEHTPFRQHNERGENAGQVDKKEMAVNKLKPTRNSREISVIDHALSRFFILSRP
jgi:hypothetical protein